MISNKMVAWVLLIAGMLNIVAFVGACTAGQARDATGAGAELAPFVPEIGGPVGAALNSMSKRFAEIEARQKDATEKMSWGEWLYGITGIGLTASSVHSKVTSKSRTRKVATGLVRALALNKKGVEPEAIAHALIAHGLPVDIKALKAAAA